MGNWRLRLARFVFIVGLTSGLGSLAVALSTQSDEVKMAERMAVVETKVKALEDDFSDRKALQYGILVVVIAHLVMSGLGWKRSK